MGATPNYALRTPDNDDPVDVQLDMTNLATDVDTTLNAAAIKDTGWVDVSVTPAAGCTTTVAKARIRNGILEVLWNGTLTVALTVPSNGDTTNTTVATFPAPWRPTSHSRALATAAGGPQLGWIITTAGAIQYVSGPPGLTAGVGGNLSCGGSMIL